MERVTLRMLMLAAATIAPQMAAPDAEPTPRAKHAEQLSAEELRAAKRPEVYDLHDVGKKESDS